MVVLTVLLTLCILLSAALAFNWSYKILWFKVSYLFDNSDNFASASSINELPTNWNDNPDIFTKDTFVQKFYTEYSIPSKKLSNYIRLLFSVAMSCYLVTIEIVLWKIKSNQNGDLITIVIWPLMALMLALIILLIQPFLILISILNKFFNDKLDLDGLIVVAVATISGLVIVLMMLSIGPFRYSGNILTKLSISGVTLMAILSGIACVSTVYYTCCSLWVYYMNSNNDLISNLEQPSYNSFQKENYLLWSSDDTLQVKATKYDFQIKQLLQEMTLESNYLTSQKKNKYMELLARYQLNLNRIKMRLSLKPWYLTSKRIFAGVFLGYCIYRLIFTFLVRVPRILTHFINYPNDYKYDFFQNKTDPLAVNIANLLDILLFHFNYQHDLESLTSQISLLLSASLFICSFSSVNTTINFILGLLPVKFQSMTIFTLSDGNETNKKNPSLIKNLIVSELTGIYVIGTILMIRSNLPYNVSMNLKELLGEKYNVPNLSIDCWFDSVFAFVCITTLLVILFAESVLNSGVYSDSDELHEH